MKSILLFLTLLGELGLGHNAVHQADGLHGVATLGGLYCRERKWKENEMDERKVNSTVQLMTTVQALNHQYISTKHHNQ